MNSRQLTDFDKETLINQIEKMHKSFLLGQISSAFIHELKNLNSQLSMELSSLFDICKREKFNNPRMDLIIERIINTFEKIQNTQKRYLSLTRDSKSIKMSKFGSILQDIINIYKPIFSKSRIYIRHEISQEASLQMVPESELNMILMNLFSNSISSLSSSNKEERIIEVKSYVKNPNLIIEIYDNGIGISENYLSKIWDAFFTTFQDRQGLGLTIVKAILKKFSGDISVLSEYGSHSLFKIQIPTNWEKEIDEKNIVDRR